MLTTVVTVIGLLPLMFQIHPNFHTAHMEFAAPGSEWWVQLSAAVVWGLSFATLLTLALTPVMLAAPEVYKQRWQKHFGKKPRASHPTIVEDGLPKAAE
jgi:multidrug efflux pump